MPLNAMVPLYKLPWVFTYNSWSHQYDYMVMAAVRTAQAVGGLKAYCLFTGDETATIYNWLKRQQVHLHADKRSTRQQTPQRTNKKQGPSAGQVFTVWYLVMLVNIQATASCLERYYHATTLWW